MCTGCGGCGKPKFEGPVKSPFDGRPILDKSSVGYRVNNNDGKIDLPDLDMTGIDKDTPSDISPIDE